MSRLRILIISPSMPFPADNGGKLRAAAVALGLAERHEVVMACFADAPSGPPADGVADRFRELTLVPLPKPPRRLRRWLSASPSDVHQFASAEMAHRVRETVARFAPDVLLTGDPALTAYVAAYAERVRVLDNVCEATLQFDRFRALASGPRLALWALRRRKHAAHLRRIARHYDLCVLNSDADRAALLAASPGWTRAEVVPNGLDLAAYPVGLASPEPNTLVFHGATTYGPNLDAVRYFVAEILPRIRAAVPDARLMVTGKAPANGSVPQGPGVVYTGYVPDVRPLIARAWACPVPLRLGAGGTRFKVLEALALGTPVVSTAIGVEGVAVTDGVDVLMAEDPSAFAAQTTKLLRSPDLRARLAAGGRGLIEREYNWTVLSERFSKLLDELVAKRRSADGFRVASRC